MPKAVVVTEELEKGAKKSPAEKVRKVLRSPINKDGETPKIIFEGDWLMDFGFAVGVQYKLTCDLGKIIIEKI